MAYHQQLADRVRQRMVELADANHLEEKEMMGGLCIMYHDKMCVGILKDELMCRVAPEVFEECLTKPCCRPMQFTGRTSKGFVLVEDTVLKNQKDLDHWLQLSIDFNPRAKSSKKKK
jgi:TfoX/Sxy family transcriptional regulator of competence genes